MKTALTFFLTALAIAAAVPAAAGERYRPGYDHDYAYEGEVLNGRLNSFDFNGGVGANASYGSDCCYGGYIGAGAFFASTSSVSASAGASAFAFGFTMNDSPPRN